jgi:uncharacterized repeat protein (TIGR03803 family)
MKSYGRVGIRKKTLFAVVILTGILCATLGLAVPVSAQPYATFSPPESVVYNFTGGADGSRPIDSVIQASDGNLYGTTHEGGSSGVGTVFKISNPTTSPSESVIYTFTGGSDGSNPQASLIEASDGNLYGTTVFGSSIGYGTVFKISNPTTSPTESVIYAFTGGSDGGSPHAGLIQASDGNLYGTTLNGGSNGFGTVFKISNPTTTPTESVIYSFTGGSDGGYPYASVIQASDGNLYGTTYAVGSNGFGNVFKISNPTTSPTESVIYSFSGGSDGANPQASLIQASDGNLYGTTVYGGSGSAGTVFEISNLTTSPTFSVIYTFTGGSDGGNPYAAVIQASDGNLYGTTGGGGSIGYGTVFKITNPTTSPTESVIYSFTGGSDGSIPTASLIQASDGNLYGTTTGGGNSGNGVVFRVHSGPCAPPGPCVEPVAPSPVTPVTGRRSVNAAAVHYYTIAPCRLVDTRPTSHAPFGGPPLGSNETRSWPWAGNCGLPADAVAVSANVTVPLPTADGSLVFYPAGLPVPETTTIYARLGKVRANNAQIAMNGPFPGVASVTSSIPGGTTNVIVDVNGYFK